MVLGLIGFGGLGALSAEEEVNVYSHRHYESDEALFEEFTKETGIKVNVVKGGDDGLLERLKQEGDKSPADVLITADAMRLTRAKEMGLLQPIESEVLEEAIPAKFRDPEGEWYGLTKRARVIVYSKDRVKPEELSTYEELTDPKWKGRILTRSSSNAYNQSLIASQIAHHGEEKAEAWAKGLVENFARPPQGSDRDQVRAVAAGEGDLAIVNTYYMGILANGSDEDRAVAEKTAVFFPNQESTGTHVNISGGGVTRHAPHKENAVKLLEFLASDKAQKGFAEGTYEYPVKPGVDVAETVAAWGEFKEDDLPLEKIGEVGGNALQTADRAGWK